MAETFDERGEPIGIGVMEEPMPPPQAAPSAPFVAPSLAGRSDVIPGQHGGMIVPTGGNTAGPSPVDQRRIQTYMEQMAKAGQVDKAYKDVEQAMRFLGMRGVEKDVENGVPYPVALSKHLPYISYGSPQQAATYSRIIDAAAPPTPPVSSARAIPLSDENGAPIPGHFAVPSATGKGFTVHRKADIQPQLTPAQKRLELNDAIRDKNAEIAAVPWVPEKDKAGRAARQQQLDKLNAELKDLKSQRPLAKKTEEAPAAVPPKEQRKVGQVYQTPKGPHRWTAQGWEKAS